jgi:hypothetical protein
MSAVKLLMREAVIGTGLGLVGESQSRLGRHLSDLMTIGGTSGLEYLLLRSDHSAMESAVFLLGSGSS